MNGFGATVHLQFPDGSLERISPSRGLFYQASISSSGYEVVFYGAESGRPRIWRHTVGTSRLDPLSPAESGSRHPSFDWQGTRLTFASDRHSPVPGETVEEVNLSTRHVREGVQMHVYACNADGSDVTQVTEGPYLDHRPSFSPDGRWIAFASNRSGKAGIWRVPADGSSDPVPVMTTMWAFRPWFAGDGKAIFAYGPDGDRHRIWRIDVETGALKRLASDDAGDTHGPFVQRGLDDRVLAHSTRSGSWRLWEFPVKGSEPPTDVTPAAIRMAAHGTRSEDGTLAFDVVDSR